MPIHVPKILVFGVLTPKRDWSSSRPPKLKHILGRNRAYGDRSSGATWARAEGIKKRKARKETYSDKLGVRPDHPR